MASVVVEKRERERVLSFGTGGRLGFDFWRMQIQSVLLMGSFGLVAMNFQTRNRELGLIYLWVVLIGLGVSVTGAIRFLWRSRRDSLLFLKSQGGLDGTDGGDRFSTGIERSSPLTGGIGTEFFLLFVMALMVWWIFNLEMRRPGVIQFNGLTIFGFSCWGGMGLLSLTQIVLSFIRPARKAEVVILEQGILSSNREPDWFEKLPNEFYPWSCIERVVAEPGSLWRDRTLQIDVDRWPWYRRIRFVRIREEDWERMLGVIGERVEVVRE